MRQPKYRPIIRPRGKPKIIATEVPVATILKAIARCSLDTSCTAIGAAIDQKTEWAQATQIRAIRSITKLTAAPDNIWPIQNNVIVASSSLFNSILETSSIKGRDNTATTQA